jgi:hypothetical protein
MQFIIVQDVGASLTPWLGIGRQFNIAIQDVEVQFNILLDVGHMIAQARCKHASSWMMPCIT